MKTGKTLQELAAEIERRAEAKRDFLAPAGKLEMNPQAELVVHNGSEETFAIADYAHGQLAEYTGIPQTYYKKMLAEAPGLLRVNVNKWLGDEGKDQRLVRTLDGRVRAFLSNRYRTLENEDLAEAALPFLLEHDLSIMSCEITERRFYLKAVDKSIQRIINLNLSSGAKGMDIVSPGIDLSNSEVGAGALGIFGGVYTGGCMNWARSKEAFLRKYHTGNRAEVSEDVYAVLTDKTKRLTDAALWAQVKDLIAAALDVKQFEAQVERLQLAAGQKIEAGDIGEVIERVGRRFTLVETERKSILAHLVEAGDLSRYGVHAAITRAAADVADYDRASELERFGGEVIELPQAEWKTLALAA